MLQGWFVDKNCPFGKLQRFETGKSKCMKVQNVYEKYLWAWRDEKIATQKETEDWRKGIHTIPRQDWQQRTKRGFFVEEKRSDDLPFLLMVRRLTDCVYKGKPFVKFRKNTHAVSNFSHILTQKQNGRITQIPNPESTTTARCLCVWLHLQQPHRILQEQQLLLANSESFFASAEGLGCGKTWRWVRRPNFTSFPNMAGFIKRCRNAPEWDACLCPLLQNQDWSMYRRTTVSVLSLESICTLFCR